MNCFAHPNVPATATCNSCGRGLCSPCSARFTMLRCQPCILSGNNTAVRKAYWTIAVTVLLLVIGFTLGFSMVYHSATHPFVLVTHPLITRQNHSKPTSKSSPVQTQPANQQLPAPNLSTFQRALIAGIQIGIIFICEYWGFKAMSERRGSHILIGTPLFWFMYFIFRLLFGVFVGMIVAPLRLYNAVRDIVVAKKTMRQLLLAA